MIADILHQAVGGVQPRRHAHDLFVAAVVAHAAQCDHRRIDMVHGLCQLATIGKPALG